ncbi:hypothetical protein DSO57_1029194 [Entomophthora muscae]|uniref:Uncharacterized protein n=2 Tax=Entomophthora muscae TaxID=34485 RepID=A0ACC2SJ27_9FUNG|nr:hypothetical protein DSO57_1011513 [Entomophthora muscae]KAJ9068388.1 hypothetical protein DSO57_1029194 [Entomophthora muscae]
MPTIGYIVGGAFFGLGVRVYSLALQIRPIFSAPYVHAGYAGIGMGLAYWMQTVNERNDALLNDRRKRLTERREKRQQEELKKNAEAA